jgi:hypothetical protein
MNPVIGLDVAKGESQVQAYLDKKKPYSKSFKVQHNLEVLASLLDFINQFEDIVGERPPINSCRSTKPISEEFIF